MPNSFCCEALNGVVASAYPNKENSVPHVGFCLSTLVGEQGQPVVVVARFDPDEARALGAALVQSADHIQAAFEAYKVEVDGDGSLGD